MVRCHKSNNKEVYFYVFYCLGDNTYEESFQYIHDKFFESHENRTIYPHPTCATDCNQVQKVVRSCQEMIIQKNVSSTGFM